MLAADGVTIDPIEDENIGIDDRRVIGYVLTRNIGGRFLSDDMPEIESPDDFVPVLRQKRIMNKLRVPVERYAFGRL